MLLHFDHCATNINVVVVVDISADYNFAVIYNSVETIDIVVDFVVSIYHDEFWLIHVETQLFHDFDN